MDGTSSTSAEKNDKFTDLLKYAKCWTLKQDKELKDALQNTVSVMLDSIRHFETVGNALESEMELFECRFENIHNRIGCLKMERLVKEQVDEIPMDLLRGRSKKTCRENLMKEVNREEYEQRTISTISNAIRQGFEVFDVQQDQQCVNDTQNCGDPSDPSSSTEFPKNRPKKNADVCDGMEILRSLEQTELPPIIGTAEFYEAMRRANETKANNPTANQRRMGSNGSALPPAATKIEEEDISSVSSGRSAPPQDPIVVQQQQQSPSTPAAAGTMRTALMEEITGRAQKRGEISDKSEKDKEKREISQEMKRESEERRRDRREDEEKRQKMAEKRRGERRVKKSLFSSSSEGEGEEKEEDKDKEEPSNTSIGSLQRVLENRTQKLENGPTSVIKTIAAAFNMSKPVFKPFDVSFSDRLSAAIQNVPVAFRPGRSLSQRPLSVQSFGSSAGDGAPLASTDRSTAVAGHPPALVRKTESATTVSIVSNNEEFGPTSVKNRIAQIGAQIPVGGRRAADGTRREEGVQRTECTTATSKTAPLPVEAIKTRPKAPSARRAPSQRTVNGKPPMPSSSPLGSITEAATQQQKKGEEKRPMNPNQKTVGDEESSSDKRSPSAVPEARSHGSAVVTPQTAPKTAPAKTGPPPVKPKKATSIFTSSSSDDDLGFSKVIATAKAKVPPPQQSHKAKEVTMAKASTPSEPQKKPPPFSYKKIAAAPSKTRKGLFDDSDSDF